MNEADILLVEDDDAHAELIERSLEQVASHLRVARASDGEEAVERLEEAAAKSERLPKLVLLDLRLPRLGGRAVLERLKGHPVLRRVPVVILTTSRAPDDVRAAYDRHANGYLVKPPALASLSSMLADVARFWGDRNHVAS